MDGRKKLLVGITAEGSVNLLLGQLAYFKSLGYKKYLLAPYSERSAKFCENEGCEHLVINIEREISIWKDIKTLWQILKIFGRVKPDIINLGTPKVSLLGMIAGSWVGVPKRIYTCRGFRFEHEAGLKKKILIGMEKITAYFAHDVICISHSVRDLGLNYKVFSEKKSFVINKGSSNGVNLDLFDVQKLNAQDKETIQNKYNLHDVFIYGFIGRIVDRKGINELFGVFKLLYQNNPRLRLMLVGPFEMDQIANKNLMKEIDSHPGIINIGRVMQHEVPKYLAIMDVFVLPAWWEGFGNVLIQAAALGIPVVSTDATGTKDAVSPDYNGLLVPIKNEQALLEAMNRLYIDEGLRKQLGKNGIDWAKYFKREHIWDKMNEIYQA